MALLYTLAITALGLLEGRRLVRDKMWKEAVVFWVILVCGMAVIVMDTVMVNPLRVSNLIDYIFRPYYSVIRSIFLRL